MILATFLEYGQMQLRLKKVNGPYSTREHRCGAHLPVYAVSP